MKKWILVSLLFLTGCTNSATESIPLMIYDLSDNYMNVYKNQIIQAAKGMGSVEIYGANNSQLVQNNQFTQILEEDPPFIVVNPVDRLSVHGMVQEATNQEVPLIFINREPLFEDLSQSDHFYYIGSKAEESAQLQAGIIDQAFGGNPDALNALDLNQDNHIQTVILMGQQGHQDAEQRTKYVIQALEDQGYQLDILEIRVANFDYDQAHSEMLETYHTHGEAIELVISNNDAMALGAVDALMEEGVITDRAPEQTPNLPVVGIDGLPDAINYIERGLLYGTVINDSKTMSEALIDLLTAIQSSDFENFDWPIENDHYIWIEYRPLIIDSAEILE